MGSRTVVLDGHTERYTAVTLAICVVALGYPWPVVAFGIAGAAAVIALHRQNIRRLAGGTEHRFGSGVRKSGSH